MNARGKRRTELGEKIGLIGFLGASAFFAFMLWTLLAPYHPLAYEKVQPTEPEVCASSSVGVDVAYEADPELHGTIAEVDVKSDWIAVDVPGVRPGTKYDAGSSTLYPGDIARGRVEEVGSALRFAPDKPGEWLLFSSYTVRSSRPVFPPQDKLTKTADEPTSVLSNDHPDCVKER